MLTSRVADFPCALTPELAEALDEHARCFLPGQGIRDEPVQFEPPADLLDGVHLPGQKLDFAKLALLHKLVRSDGDVGEAARMADVSLEAARYLLTCQPAPAIGTSDPSRFSPHGAAYRTATQILTKERLVELYENKFQSLADIAADTGVSRQTLTCIAEDYGLELRTPGRSSTQTAPADWLFEQYVKEGRSLKDLAHERGVSTSTMARWAKTYGIPTRPRGGSHRNQPRVPS